MRIYLIKSVASKFDLNADIARNDDHFFLTDCVRANMFVAEVLGLEPECVVVPVICGHSESTIVPVLSQAKPSNDFKPVTFQYFKFVFSSPHLSPLLLLSLSSFQRPSLIFLIIQGRNIADNSGRTASRKRGYQSQRRPRIGHIIDRFCSCQVYDFLGKRSHRLV